jgi:ribosomal protein S18 acetylase RimI-like enzyme
MSEIKPMTPGDIAEALALWTGMPGIVLRDEDCPEALTGYLRRNPGFSHVARERGRLVGVSLAGHDGRRGYLHHVAVARDLRLRGVGRSLVEHCLAALRREGIARCHILVNGDNDEGFKFWQHLGWAERTTLKLLSASTSGEKI